MSRVICPNCSNDVPVNRYCIFCGEMLEGVISCINCSKEYFNNLTKCPFCSTPHGGGIQTPAIKPTPWYIKRLLPFDISLLIIFILSSYFIFQIIVATIVVLLLPFDVSNETAVMDIFSLFIMLISNLVFSFVLVKYVPFSIITIEPVKKKRQTILLLIILFLVALALLELSIRLIEFILDSFSVSPAHSSPYDNYFANPFITVLFSVLVIFIGPLFEEIIFRQHVISFINRRISSKISVILLSSIIFSFNHLPADIQNGSFRFTIEHLFVVFFLGVVLGLIYLRYGLFYAVFFHSLWNTFSLLAQISISVDKIAVYLDFLLLIGIILTIILLIIILKKIIQDFEKFIPRGRNFQILTKENGLLFGNAIVIITFDLLNAFLPNLEPNISGIGLGLLLGIHAIGIVIGFLIFEHISRTRRSNRIMLESDEIGNISK